MVALFVVLLLKLCVSLLKGPASTGITGATDWFRHSCRNSRVLLLSADSHSRPVETCAGSLSQNLVEISTSFVWFPGNLSMTFRMQSSLPSDGLSSKKLIMLWD